ncbi:conserved hypothetical protein [Neospora caninum Liverpool]|uniref:Uncharacterized protein n=1 Tax=Neospora caninum (strain Liverpool) TaxID=572307 RepID=F0VQY9_NEOCL|nr:conserved hypothetical protein [Neospora caninum Liverpool]CBZ56136.1 conserved hypothetical protein [Neospora caninum Liverpool]CEL70892.1 TPA: hypothetical protein BN1204_065620 [Neospora caninum Liverpool]|eukprot:XP_003886162.1 conserved hypothetical protein [Neospora caninum Liverpool]
MSRPHYPPHRGRLPAGPAPHQGFLVQVSGSAVSTDVGFLVPSVHDGMYSHHPHFVQGHSPTHLSPHPPASLPPENVSFLPSQTGGVYVPPLAGELARTPHRLPPPGEGARPLDRERSYPPEKSARPSDQGRLLPPHVAALPPAHRPSHPFPPGLLPFRSSSGWEGVDAPVPERRAQKRSNSPVAPSASSHRHTAGENADWNSSRSTATQRLQRSLSSSRGCELPDRRDREREGSPRRLPGSADPSLGREESYHITDAARETSLDRERRGVSHIEGPPRRARGFAEEARSREGRGESSLSRERPDEGRSQAHSRGGMLAYGESHAFHGREDDRYQSSASLPSSAQRGQDAPRGRPANAAATASFPRPAFPPNHNRAPAAVHPPVSEPASALPPSSPPASSLPQSAPNASSRYGVRPPDHAGAPPPSPLPPAFRASASSLPAHASAGVPPGSDAAAVAERVRQEGQPGHPRRSGDRCAAVGGRPQREASGSVASQQSTADEPGYRSSTLQGRRLPSPPRGTKQARIPASAEPPHSHSRFPSADRESRSRSGNQRRPAREEDRSHRPYRGGEGRGEGMQRVAEVGRGRQEEAGALQERRPSLSRATWQSRDQENKNASVSYPPAAARQSYRPDGPRVSGCTRDEGSSAPALSVPTVGPAVSSSPAALSSSFPAKKLRTALFFPPLLSSPLDYLQASANCGVSSPHEVPFLAGTSPCSAPTPLRSLRPEQHKLSLTFMLLRPLPDPLSHTLEQHRAHYMVADASASAVLVLPLTFLRRECAGEPDGAAASGGEAAGERDKADSAVSDEEKEGLIRAVKGKLQPGDVIHMTGALTSWSAKGEMVITVPVRKGYRAGRQGRQEGDDSYVTEGSLKVVGRFSFPFVTEPDMSCMFTAVAPQKGERWARGGGQMAPEFAALALKGKEKEELSREIGLAAVGASIPCESLSFPVVDPLACLGPPPPFFVLLSR